MRQFWRQVWAIFWKDIRYELRGKQTWLGMGMFALLVLLIFNFAFDLHIENTAILAPGVLWLAFLFASMLGLGRTVSSEREQFTLDRLLLCPVDRKAIYLAKLLGNLLFLFAVEVVAMPIFVAFFGIAFPFWDALLILLWGSLGIAIIGTLFSTMVTTTKARELLLPLLMFPLLLPVIIGSVRAMIGLLVPTVNEPPWLSLIIAFDCIFFALAMLLFQFVLEE